MLLGVCAQAHFAEENPDDGWINVHREAHRQGFHSTATMMYGHVDRPEDQPEHFNRVRDLQDETGGFTAFIPWSFKPGHSALEKTFPVGKGPGTYFRMLAASRLYLDTVPHIHGSWFSEGERSGDTVAPLRRRRFWRHADRRKRPFKATGHVNTTTLEYTLQMIRDAGFIPAQRTTLYDILKVHDEAPVPA